VEDLDPGEFLAECFWPGVNEGDLAALDKRAQAAALELSREGHSVRYRGSVLVRQDEVVLCCFEGSEDSVRGAAERARIPFERILVAARSPWSVSSATEQDQRKGEDHETKDQAAH
jgi:hypothetical protein